MSKRVALVLADEALDILDAHASERKRGEFISNLLVDYADRIDRTMRDDIGVLERIEAKIDRIAKAVES